MAASNTSLQYDDGTRYVYCGSVLKYDPVTGYVTRTTPVASADQATIAAITTIGTCDGTPAAGLTTTIAAGSMTTVANDLASLRRDISALHVLLLALRTASMTLGDIKGSA